MLSSFDYDLGFDSFNHVTVLLLCCGFVLFIIIIIIIYFYTYIYIYVFSRHIVVNFDYNFYYPRINKYINKKRNLWEYAGQIPKKI